MMYAVPHNDIPCVDPPDRCGLDGWNEMSEVGKASAEPSGTGGKRWEAVPKNHTLAGTEKVRW